MRDDLAERVLAEVMDWGPAELREFGSQLQALAMLKYDEYEGYRPGEKFLESLAGWLSQFDDVDDRQRLAEFAMSELVFVSRAEMEHAIETVYPDVIRPMLIRKVAGQIDEPVHRVASITTSAEFRSLQRRTLVLGLADGARIDRLRRATPDLSHEQIYPAPELSDSRAKKLRASLIEDLDNHELPGERRFAEVVLVDDFSGSGFTLIRPDGEWKGKLWNIKSQQLTRLAELGVTEADPSVTVVLYMAGNLARERLEKRLRESGLAWDLYVVHHLGPEVTVTNDRLLELSEEFFDREILMTDHLEKGQRDPAHGFGGAALPLVVHHNTPNNSIALLWADTSERGGHRRRALFPRRERHQ